MDLRGVADRQVEAVGRAVKAAGKTFWRRGLASTPLSLLCASVSCLQLFEKSRLKHRPTWALDGRRLLPSFPLILNVTTESPLQRN